MSSARLSIPSPEGRRPVNAGAHRGPTGEGARRSPEPRRSLATPPAPGSRTAAGTSRPGLVPDLANPRQDRIATSRLPLRIPEGPGIRAALRGGAGPRRDARRGSILDQTKNLIHLSVTIVLVIRITLAPCPAGMNWSRFVVRRGWVRPGSSGAGRGPTSERDAAGRGRRGRSPCGFAWTCSLTCSLRSALGAGSRGICSRDRGHLARVGTSCGLTGHPRGLEARPPRGRRTRGFAWTRSRGHVNGRPSPSRIPPTQPLRARRDMR